MKDYLAKNLDWRTQKVADNYDELPLWSAPFGLLLMNNFPIGNYSSYLDIGSGTGFPLIDIAQRLGRECKSYGVDPWHSGVNKARSKIDPLGLMNIKLLEADASNLPYPDEFFDLATSNLGLNNFEHPSSVLTECYRVLKPGASFCTTSNLKGTFKEFYSIFEKTLNDLELMEKYGQQLSEHLTRRGTIRSVRQLIEQSGFKIVNQIESLYQMRFLNGSALLNYAFVNIGFMPSWRDIFEDEDRQVFFETFENNLNEYSNQKGELKLTIPMVYLECKK